MDPSYAQSLAHILRPVPDGGPLVVDLFAGCGGLALGFEAQGFATQGFEMDSDACATYRKNLLGDCIQTILTPDTPLPKADVLIGARPASPLAWVAVS